MVLISKTGCGMSYLCQAIDDAACRKLIEVRYTHLAQICESLDRARAVADGSYYELIGTYKVVPLLIIGDFMTTPIGT